MANLPFVHSVDVTDTKSNESTISVIDSITAGINSKQIDEQTITISNFTRADDFVVTTEYPDANSVSIAQFDLPIVALPDTTFQFILSIRNGNTDASPVLITSKAYYDLLTQSYSEGDPYTVINAIKSAAMVCIDYSRYVEKIKELKLKEFDVARVGVAVNRYNFVNSTHKASETGVAPNIDYTLDVDHAEIARYVDYIVSKKDVSAKSNPNELGEWISFEELNF